MKNSHKHFLAYQGLPNCDSTSELRMLELDIHVGSHATYPFQEISSFLPVRKYYFRGVCTHSPTRPAQLGGLIRNEENALK